MYGNNLSVCGGCHAFADPLKQHSCQKHAAADKSGCPELGALILAPADPSLSSILSRDPLTADRWLEIVYWKRTIQTAHVETAQEHDLPAAVGSIQRWAVSDLPVTVTSPGPAGWNGVVWRMKVDDTAGVRWYGRVRFDIL